MPKHLDSIHPLLLHCQHFISHSDSRSSLSICSCSAPVYSTHSSWNDVSQCIWGSLPTPPYPNRVKSSMTFHCPLHNDQTLEHGLRVWLILPTVLIHLCSLSHLPSPQLSMLQSFCPLCGMWNAFPTPSLPPRAFIFIICPPRIFPTHYLTSTLTPEYPLCFS